MAASDRFGIQGHVSRGFEAVREASPRTLFGDASWVEPAAPLSAARRSSTCGAVFGTSGPASPGSRTRWWWSTQPPRAWPR